MHPLHQNIILQVGDGGGGGGVTVWDRLTRTSLGALIELDTFLTDAKYVNILGNNLHSFIRTVIQNL